jgi:maltooligosyltrehalose trehalohydrolase
VLFRSLDVVYNHLGPWGNHLADFGPYFTDRYATPWGDAVNLDGPGSDEVRAFFVENALAWLRDHHLDGLRLDAVHALLDTSATHLLEELGGRVRELSAQLGRQLFVVAESDRNDPRLVAPVEAGGFGLDAVWSDDFHHALHAALTGERDGYYADFGSLADVAAALRRAYVYDGRWSAFRGRRHGRPVGGLPGHRFLGYLQNHDQVGNRARGERTSHLLPTGLLEVGAALVLTSPFTPMLFQGEEWGATAPFPYFTDHQDPALAEAVRRGRREEFVAFGWAPEDVPDPQDPATFRSAKLDWAEVGRDPHARLLDWHRALVALRRSVPDLADGRLDRVRTWWDEGEGWIAVGRGQATVMANLSGREAVVPLGRDRPRGLLAASAEAEPRFTPSGVRVGPRSALVLG